MRSQTTRIIAGRVNADGTPAGGSGFTSRKTATGTYAVGIPGARLVNLVASTTGGAVGAVTTATAGDGATLVTVGTTGSAADAGFQFVATVTA